MAAQRFEAANSRKAASLESIAQRSSLVKLPGDVLERIDEFKRADETLSRYVDRRRHSERNDRLMTAIGERIVDEHMKSIPFYHIPVLPGRPYPYNPGDGWTKALAWHQKRGWDKPESPGIAMDPPDQLTHPWTFRNVTSLVDHGGPWFNYQPQWFTNQFATFKTAGWWRFMQG